MNSNIELVELIIERVVSNAPNDGAFFYWDEVSTWPDGKLALFEKIGLLNQAQPMSDIECDGCEQNCFMPVTFRNDMPEKPAHAYVTCDKRDDIGRVAVDFKRLTQWQLTAMQLAQFVANLCEVTQQVVKDGDYWRLGMLQGKKHKAPILMGFDNTRAILKIAGHRADLLELLFIDDSQCRIDLKKLKALADSPTGLADDTESAEARQDRLLARKNALKIAKVRNFNMKIAEEENMSLANVKKLISAAEIRKKNQIHNPYLQLRKRQ